MASYYYSDLNAIYIKQENIDSTDHDIDIEDHNVEDICPDTSIQDILQYQRSETSEIEKSANMSLGGKQKYQRSSLEIEDENEQVSSQNELTSQRLEVEYKTPDTSLHEVLNCPQLPISEIEKNRQHESVLVVANKICQESQSVEANKNNSAYGEPVTILRKSNNWCCIPAHKENDKTTEMCLPNKLNVKEESILPDISKLTSNILNIKSSLLLKRFECPTCAKSYKHKYHLQRHVKVECGKEANLLCEHCSFRTKQKISLQRHLINKHDGPYCGKPEIPRVAINSVEGPRFPYPCSNCDKSYKHQFALYRHMTMECVTAENMANRSDNVDNDNDIPEVNPVKYEPSTNNVEKAEHVVECEIPIKLEPLESDEPDFDYQIQIEDTLSAEDTLSVEKVRPERKRAAMQCPKCNMSFSAKSLLVRHIEMFCGSELLLRCEHCNYSTLKKNGLTKHFQRIHANLIGVAKTTARFKCPTCERSYKTQHGLLDHIRYACNQDKQFKCTQCDYSGHRKHHLKSHIINNHPKVNEFQLGPMVVLPTNDRHFQCPICLKAYKYRADLNRHQKLRCGKNPQYPCLTCNRCYIRPDVLERHVKLECGKEPQFKCQSCDYRSKRRYSLKCHIAHKHPMSTQIA